MAIRLEPYLSPLMLPAGHLTKPFSTVTTSIMSRLHMRSASRSGTKLNSNTWKDSTKSWMTSLMNLDQILLLAVSECFKPFLRSYDSTSPVVAETVVGATTGVVPPPRGYFKAMKSVCDKYGALFILDEVMSGMGREYLLTCSRNLIEPCSGLGTLHAWQTFADGVSPDLQAVAKGLGGGYVIAVSPRRTKLTTV
jgi:acetylornithine/succinyldiaminopimelate/putrescine aminotransferase